MGSVFGPTIGAVALLVLEESLPFLIGRVGTPLAGEAALRAAEYWQIVLGPMLLAIVLFARGGIFGLLARTDRG
jgi:branched-chain amino acid transport system permease protein